MEYHYWKKRSKTEINNIISNALRENISFYDSDILGVPASHLDPKVFAKDDEFLSDKPFLKTMLNNPNHIGCHTLGDSERFFNGTQEIEREVIRICAHDILKGSVDEKFDGYVTSGGTEANLQAIWVYRNYFVEEKNASLDEIAIICSSDTHYSVNKASNVFSIANYKVEVDFDSREISTETITNTIENAKADGKKYFIVLVNMMTTMFGSVDNPDLYISVLQEQKLDFKLHVDGAYGGFFYPFSTDSNKLNFKNPHVSSITLDAHKMAQAPYGTGIILFRDKLIGYTRTKEAKYVAGEDFTLVGSRSGANVIAIWMILSTYGAQDWIEKVQELVSRTNWLSQALDKLNVEYFRAKDSNIVTIKSESLANEIAEKYILVPDNHKDSKWFKIVVMEHVTIDRLENFIEAISTAR